MVYESMPLYPALRSGREAESCVRVPVFPGGDWTPGNMNEADLCRRVTIENPCRPGERAEVLLGLDGCGNLVVCVRRDWDCRPPQGQACRPSRPCLPEPCPPPRPCRPKEPCRPRRGRLYGTW